ncbi:MAG: hypothetical protein CL663_07695 [Bacteroidetes bacterium]|nr:hypothetical protein [Bacteroidota bacterium]
MKVERTRTRMYFVAIPDEERENLVKERLSFGSFSLVIKKMNRISKFKKQPSTSLVTELSKGCWNTENKRIRVIITT